MILEMFEYLNYFESLKLLMYFWNLLLVITFDIWKNDYFLNHLWYIFVRLKYMIYLQLIILRLWNFFSYSWKPIVYYNFWKLILHLITLQIYCLIELIRILVTYWVVSSPTFPLQFQIVKNTKFWDFDVVLWAGKEAQWFWDWMVF